MASKKTQVITHLFDQRYDKRTKKVRGPEVTLSDVVDAIDATGATLSKKNPANFFKDIVRMRTRNDVFPSSVVARGYTAEQLVGEEMCFRFVPLPVGQTTAFAELEPDPSLLSSPHVIQSVSLSIPSRRLGRGDESWLTQVAVRLNLVHTHLALFSKLNVLGVDILQTNVKLSQGEIDAVFIAAVESDGGHGDLLIACEMKSRTEVLEQEQVLRGALALAASKHVLDLGHDVPVLPMAVKALGQGLLWVIEYSTTFPPLNRVGAHIYRFEPAVKGVG